MRSKLGVQFDAAQSTAELQRAFARRTDLKLVLDVAQLRQLAVDGVKAGVWDYQDPELGDHGWATKDDPTGAPIKISPDTFLHPPGSAPAPAAATCPLCGKVHPGAVCGVGPTRPPLPTGSTFEASGGASFAITQVISQAQEAGRTQLRVLSVSIDVSGAGKENELAKLQTMLPTGVVTTVVEYRLRVRVGLDTPARSVLVEFTGTPGQWTPLGSAVRQVMAGRDAIVNATLRADFPTGTPLEGESMQRIQQAAGQTGPVACTVRITTEASA